MVRRHVVPLEIIVAPVVSPYLTAETMRTCHIFRSESREMHGVLANRAFFHSDEPRSQTLESGQISRSYCCVLKTLLQVHEVIFDVHILSTPHVDLTITESPKNKKYDIIPYPRSTSVNLPKIPLRVRTVHPPMPHPILRRPKRCIPPAQPLERRYQRAWTRLRILRQRISRAPGLRRRNIVIWRVPRTETVG